MHARTFVVGVKARHGRALVQERGGVPDPEGGPILPLRRQMERRLEVLGELEASPVDVRRLRRRPSSRHDAAKHEAKHAPQAY